MEYLWIVSKYVNLLFSHPWKSLHCPELIKQLAIFNKSKPHLSINRERLRFRFWRKGFKKMGDLDTAKPLRKIAEAFKELEATINSQSQEVEVAPFSHACSLVSPLFGCLGIAFKFAEVDYVAKVIFHFYSLPTTHFFFSIYNCLILPFFMIKSNRCLILQRHRIRLVHYKVC